MLRRIATIFRRDLFDAIRDGRILFAVLIPVALAVYYAAVLPDPDELPSATLALAGDAAEVRSLEDAVRDAVEGRLELRIDRVDARADARERAREDGDVVGAVVGDGVARGRGTIELFIDESPSTDAALLASTLGDVALQLGASEPPVEVRVVELEDPEGAAPFDRLGINRALVIFSIVMLSGFIAVIAVPVLLMEEVQLRTLEALQLVASTWEIVIAKVLVGLVYCALAIGIVLGLSDLELAHPLWFGAATLALAVVLLGYGLAFGLALGDPGRVNTWSGAVLMPLFVPVFAALGERQPWSSALELLPTAGGTLLLAEAADPSSIELRVLPLVSFGMWGVAGFALIWWLLARREA